MPASSRSLFSAPPDFLEGSAKAIAGLPKIGLQIQSGMKLHYRFRKTTGAGEHETEIVMSVLAETSGSRRTASR